MADKFSGWHVFTRVLERVFVASNGRSVVCFLRNTIITISGFNAVDRFTISRFCTPIQFGLQQMSVAAD